MSAPIGSSCCGCVNDQCWACPLSSQCDLSRPYNCTAPRKTCATVRCALGYFCHEARAPPTITTFTSNPSFSSLLRP